MYPKKQTMEPKNDAEDDFPFHFGVIFRFHVSFWGAYPNIGGTHVFTSMIVGGMIIQFISIFLTNMPSTGGMKLRKSLGNHRFLEDFLLN